MMVSSHLTTPCLQVDVRNGVDEEPSKEGSKARTVELFQSGGEILKKSLFPD